MAYKRAAWHHLPVQGPQASASGSDHSARPLWTLKAMLLGQIGTAPPSARWTLVGSSDGVTAGMDGVDRWGATYAVTKMPYAAGTAPYAWTLLSKVFQTPGGAKTAYLLLTPSGASNANGWSRVESGLGYSGGSVSALPTINLPIARTHTGDAVSSTYPNAAFMTDTTSLRRAYGSVSAIGEFWIAEVVNGEVSWGAMFFQPDGCLTNDASPFFGYCSNSSAGWTGYYRYAFCGVGLWGGLQSGTDRPQATHVGACGPSGYVAGTYYNGAAGYPVLVTTPGLPYLDVAQAAVADRPVFVEVYPVSDATQTSWHSRGRLPDVGAIATLRINVIPVNGRPCNIGTTIRNQQTGLIEYVTMGQLLVPYNDLVG